MPSSNGSAAAAGSTRRAGRGNKTNRRQRGKATLCVFWGHDLNIKVMLNVYRSDSICERFIVDTDPHDVQWDQHKRVTRDFYIHPFPAKSGAVTRVTFSYIAHLCERSIPSQQEYVLFDEWHLRDGHSHHRHITMEGSTPNGYRTRELDAGELQGDVDWCNHYFESLHLTPKFTKGQPYHPYHPKPYIHERIDATIRKQHENPHQQQSIKVCVDCI